MFQKFATTCGSFQSELLNLNHTSNSMILVSLMSPKFARWLRQVVANFGDGTLAEAVISSTLDGAFVAGPIDHPDLVATVAFKEELVLLTARRWKSLADLRAETPTSGPAILVFRTGCSYRQRLEHLMSELGWPSAARLKFGTLDGIIGCVAAAMGVTLQPRTVAERAEPDETVRLHALGARHRHVETLFIRRRATHEGSALRSFLACLDPDGLRDAA